MNFNNRNANSEVIITKTEKYIIVHNPHNTLFSNCKYIKYFLLFW